MKTFRYALGHNALTTMTVGELRAKLAQYPDDMPVLGTWEGTSNPFRQDGFNVEHYHCGKIEDECDALMIDVDQNY
jgi:hypothetical protein